MSIPGLILEHGGTRVPRRWIRERLVERGHKRYGLAQWAKRSQWGVGGNKNITTKNFQESLRRLEQAGFIRRTETDIIVLDRVGLMERASR